MGLQSMTFYMLVTWFAPIAQSLGRTEVVAGIDVMIYQFFCFGGTLIVPLLLRGGSRATRQRRSRHSRSSGSRG